MKEGTKVDFIGIGAQKAGTTWLYHSLKQIPGFDLPYEKELHYFSRSKLYGNQYYKHPNAFRRMLHPLRLWSTISKVMDVKDKEKRKWYKKWLFSNYTDSWYLSLFDNLEGIKGEITPNYSILSVGDIKKMHILLPAAKIIFFIRNPIDRCISHYYDMYSRHDPDFQKKEIDPKHFLAFTNSKEQEIRSDYLKTLNTYRQVFPKEQILVCFFDAIKESPKKLLQNICLFLGKSDADLNDNLIIKRKINPSNKPDIPGSVHQALQEKYKSLIKELHKDLGSYCTKWLNDLNNMNTGKEKLTPTLHP